MSNTWDRLKNNDGKYIEPAKAHRIFYEYLKLKDGRTITQLDKKLKQNKKDTAPIQTLYKYSSLYNWNDRAKDFDNYHLEKAQRELGEIYIKDMKSSYGIANKIKMSVAKTIDELENDDKTYAHLKLRGLNDGSYAFANADKTQREITNIVERSKNTNLDVNMDAEINSNVAISKPKSVFDKIADVDKILDGVTDEKNPPPNAKE